MNNRPLHLAAIKGELSDRAILATIVTVRETLSDLRMALKAMGHLEDAGTVGACDTALSTPKFNAGERLIYDSELTEQD